MADGSVKFDTAIDSSGLRTGLAGLGKVALAGVGAASAALVAFGKQAVETGMSFDSSMSQVAATMGKTVDEIEELRVFAQKMGAETAFSASQAADALNYMALAGYSAEQSMEMLPNVLNLAASGAMDLAAASDMITDSQTALGLTFEQTNIMVDQMAKTASTTNTSVAQLGAAILTVGGNAKILKGGTNELNAVLGVLADNGIKASEAGTHLRNILLSLNPTTDKQIEAWDQLGISAYDAEGNMRSLDEVFGDISKSLDGMSDQERTDILSKMFNRADLNSVNALLATTEERWDTVYGAIENASGAAQKMADTQLDNLQGDLTIMQSAFEGLQISVSDGLTPTLRDFVQLGTEQLGILNDAMKEGGFSGLIEAAGTVLGNVVNKIVSFTPTLVEAALGLLENLITTILDSSGMIIDAAIDIGMQLVQSVVSLAPKLVTAAANIVSQLATGLAKALPQLIKTFIAGWAELQYAIIDSIPVLLDAAMTIIDAIVGALPEMIPMLLEAVTGVFTAVLELLPELIPALLEAVLMIVTAIIEYLPELITLLVEQLPIIVEQIVTTLIELLPVLIEGVMAIVNAVIACLPEIIIMICGVLPQLIQSIVSTLLDAIPLIIQCGVDLITSLVQALPEIIYAIVSVLPVIIQSIISTLVMLIPELIECGIELLTSLISSIDVIIINIVAVIPQIIMSVISALVDCIPQLIECGIQLFCSLIEALPDIIIALVAAAPTIITSIIDALIDCVPQLIECGIELFLSLIKALPDIITSIVKSAPKIVESLVKAFGGLGSRFIEVGKNLMAGIGDGIANAAGSIVNKAKEVGQNIVNGVKDFFGIHSPSRLFKDVIGKNLMFGLAEGIEDEASTAVAAMGEAAKEVGDVEFSSGSITFDDPDDLYRKVSGTVNAQVVGTTAAKAAVVNSYDSISEDDGSDVAGDNQPTYIENNIIIDGRKAARIITPYVAQELAWEGK